MFEIDSKHICSNDKKQVTTKQNKIKKSHALKQHKKAKKIQDQELLQRHTRDRERMAKYFYKLL